MENAKITKSKTEKNTWDVTLEDGTWYEVHHIYSAGRFLGWVYRIDSAVSREYTNRHNAILYGAKAARA